MACTISHATAFLDPHVHQQLPLYVGAEDGYVTDLFFVIVAESKDNLDFFGESKKNHINHIMNKIVNPLTGRALKANGTAGRKLMRGGAITHGINPVTGRKVLLGGRTGKKLLSQTGGAIAAAAAAALPTHHIDIEMILKPYSSSLARSMPSAKDILSLHGKNIEMKRSELLDAYRDYAEEGKQAPEGLDDVFMSAKIAEDKQDAVHTKYLADMTAARQAALPVAMVLRILVRHNIIMPTAHPAGYVDTVSSGGYIVAVSDAAAQEVANAIVRDLLVEMGAAAGNFEVSSDTTVTNLIDLVEEEREPGDNRPAHELIALEIESRDW